MNSMDQFIQAVRIARTDGVIENHELDEALQSLSKAQDVSQDVKAYVVRDLLDTSVSRGRRGGLRLDDGTRTKLADFVARNDTDWPGLWLDRPKAGPDSATRFANQIRSLTTQRSPIRGRDLSGALAALESATDLSRAVKGHLAENLWLVSNRSDSGVRIDDAGKRLLSDFVRRVDPQRLGLGWLENPE